MQLLLSKVSVRSLLMKWAGNSARKQKEGKEPRPPVILVKFPRSWCGAQRATVIPGTPEEFWSPASVELSLHCLLGRATALKMTWKQISSTTLLRVTVTPGTAINAESFSAAQSI